MRTSLWKIMWRIYRVPLLLCLLFEIFVLVEDPGRWWIGPFVFLASGLYMLPAAMAVVAAVWVHEEEL